MPSVSAKRIATPKAAITTPKHSANINHSKTHNDKLQNKWWVAGAGKVGKVAPKPAIKLPGISKDVKAFFDANVAAGKAISQMDMNEGAFKIDGAASKMLHNVAEELVYQYEERGLTKKANAIRSELAKFDTRLAGEVPDPQGGSIAPLELAMDHTSKRMNYMTRLAAELSKVTKKPSAEDQSSYNSQARAGEVVAGANFINMYEKKSNDGNAERIAADLKGFFSGLQGRIDKKVENEGGSLEPLERSALLATELNAMSKKMSLHVPEL